MAEGVPTGLGRPCFVRCVTRLSRGGGAEIDQLDAPGREKRISRGEEGGHIWRSSEWWRRRACAVLGGATRLGAPGVGQGDRRVG
jgi:hypothetical protein